MDFAVGRSNFMLQTVVSVQKRYLYIQLAIYDTNSKAYFHALLGEKQAIEHEIGSELKWGEQPKRKSSYIALYNQNRDPSDRSDWVNQHEWMLVQLEAFRRCFAPRVKSLGTISVYPLVNGLEPEE